MIRSLRSRHRKLILSLSFVIAPLFVAGLAVRHLDPSPSSTRVGADPASPSRDATSIQAKLVDGTALRLYRSRIAPGSGGEIVVEATDSSGLPELLVYWIPDGAAGDALDDGFLLGRLTAGETGPLALPLAAISETEGAGKIVFYSPAHREPWGEVELASGGRIGEAGE